MKKKIISAILMSACILMPFNVYAYSENIIVGGENIGIHIDTGVLIIGFYKVNGSSVHASTKLNIGDEIVKVEQTPVSNIEELTSAIDKELKEDQITLTIKRANETFETTLDLIKVDDIYKTGLYVKDGISGIGTLTYIDPETKIFGTLGHEIIESNSKTRVEVKQGNIYESKVTKIEKSEDGKVGEKNATIQKENIYGNITKNTLYGVFGNYTEEIHALKTLPVGKKEEIKLGKASIYTVLKNNERQEYEITITKINPNSDIKNIAFEITDETLLKETGGVIQGMSGSPIIQDGKVIGAVTHAIVDNVKTGYGIFITTMLEEGEE